MSLILKTYYRGRQLQSKNKSHKYKYFDMYRIAFFILVLFSYNNVSAQEGTNLIKKMVAVIQTTEGARFTLKKSERFGNSYEDGELKVKFKVNPLEIYSYSIKPNKDSEVLWKEGDKKLLVKQGTFPYLSLNMNLFNYFILKGNHHIITHTPFTYFGKILSNLLSKVDTNGNKIEFVGTVDYNGQSCYHVKMYTDNFITKTVTTDRSETLIEYADRNFLSPHLMQKLNDLSYDDVLKPGQSLTVTNEYAKSMDVYIEKSTLLPVLLDIFDDKGRLEKYEFLNIERNPVFDSDEFNRNYSEYNF